MMDGQLVGVDIICLAHLPWDGPWKAYHQIVSRMAESNRVFCIDPPSPLRQALDSVRGRASIPPAVRRVSDNLFIYHAPWWLSRSREALAERIIEPLRIRHARWTSRRFGFGSSILWTFEPTLARYTNLFTPRFLVYHVVDDYVEYLVPSATLARARMAHNHQQLLRRANVVFAVSPELRERCRWINASTYLVPNGVDFDRFQRVMADPYVPEDIRAIRRPIVGYVGAIEPKFDVETLSWLASARPQWSVVIVGPAYPSVHEQLLELVQRYENVHYLMGKRPEEVPYYIKSLDVALLADREDHTDGDSIKLYEYLACGRPVVSFEFNFLRRVRDLVWLARDRDDFVRCVERALGDPPRSAVARVAFAREQTWQHRVEMISGLIAEHLQEVATTCVRKR